jgi:hypothetical protein
VLTQTGKNGMHAHSPPTDTLGVLVDAGPVPHFGIALLTAEAGERGTMRDWPLPASSRDEETVRRSNTEARAGEERKEAVARCEVNRRREHKVQYDGCSGARCWLAILEPPASAREDGPISSRLKGAFYPILLLFGLQGAKSDSDPRDSALNPARSTRRKRGRSSRTLGAGRWMLDAGRWTLDARQLRQTVLARCCTSGAKRSRRPCIMSSCHSGAGSWATHTRSTA